MSGKKLRWKSLHAFVAMPYGIKDGIDFNKVYDYYIKSALENEGFDVFRADEEMKAGDIRKDMFQELLLADLVVVDLSIDNPNVWYELGVRHALRSRGVIQIQSQREYMPFDIYVDRTLRYHIKNGEPDPNKIETDKKKLAQFAIETMNSWHESKISPVYQILHDLNEPDWRSFKMKDSKEFWGTQKLWVKQINIAFENNNPGDILLLAEEAPSWILRLESMKKAGQLLLNMKEYEFAMDQFEKALLIDPGDLESKQKIGIILGRNGKYSEAKVHIHGILKAFPNDSESWALLGRVQKDEWCNSWRKTGLSTNKMRENASYEEAYLRVAINTYDTGFKMDPGNYYPGINCVTLIHIFKHLTGENEFDERLKILEGGVRWAVDNALFRNNKDYWARVTLGDLDVLGSDQKTVVKSYKDAIVVAGKRRFALDSSLQQLVLLKELEFRPRIVNACIDLFSKKLEKLDPPEEKWEPVSIFLFSGHMIDRDGREIPRFPANSENAAKIEISQKLDDLNAGEGDLAMCGGACGGDLLFAEACLERGLKLEIRIPFNEPKFLEESVTFAGEQWRNRFYKVKQNPRTDILVLPEELGKSPRQSNPYERNNLWQLYTALSLGLKKIHFICLWDGKSGDGPGGTKHMIDVVNSHTGMVHIIDTNNLLAKT